MTARMLLIGMTVLWLALFVGSVLVSPAFDVPRNFEIAQAQVRLVQRWQIAAFVVAILLALLAWKGQGLTKALRALGFAPLCITAAIMLAVAI